jgi:hypothetical protein
LDHRRVVLYFRRIAMIILRFRILRGFDFGFLFKTLTRQFVIFSIFSAIT